MGFGWGIVVDCLSLKQMSSVQSATLRRDTKDIHPTAIHMNVKISVV